MNPNTYQIQKLVSIELRSCGACGAFVALTPEQWQRLEEGKDADDWNRRQGFWCPNGHNRIYGESAADRQRERAERAEADVRRLQGEVSVRDAQLKRREQDLHRLNRGVCTHCHRTFINLQRHMQTKHPEAVTA